MSNFLRLWLFLVLLTAGACALLAPQDAAALRANADDAYASGFIDEDQYHRILGALDRAQTGDRWLELLAIFAGGAVGGVGGPPAVRGVRAVARKVAQRKAQVA